MDRMFKWLLPALIVVEVILVRAGVLDLTAAVVVVVGIEVLLLLVAARQIAVAVRRYRRDRAGGLDLWEALEGGLAVLLPRRIARLAALEPLLWICLGRWLLRRHHASDSEFSYHKDSIVGPFLVVVLFTTPVEVLLFELLIPWAWVRWMLLVGAIYMLFWVFGFYASLVVLSHRLEATGMRLHYGVLADGRIPYAEIAGVERERLRSPGGRDGLRVAREENAAYLAVGGETDVTLRLHSPVALHGLLGPTIPVATVHLAADDPQRLAGELGRRVEDEAVKAGQGSDGLPNTSQEPS